MNADTFTPRGRPADLHSTETYCRDCGAIWRAASRICHCPACHRTFTGLAGFDGHQVTVCDRCTVDEPCVKGNHRGAWRVVCVADAATQSEIAADVAGRYKVPVEHADRLVKARAARQANRGAA